MTGAALTFAVFLLLIAAAFAFWMLWVAWSTAPSEPA